MTTLLQLCSLRSRGGRRWLHERHAWPAPNNYISQKYVSLPLKSSFLTELQPRGIHFPARHKTHHHYGLLKPHFGISAHFPHIWVPVFFLLSGNSFVVRYSLSLPCVLFRVCISAVCFTSCISAMCLVSFVLKELCPHGRTNTWNTNTKAALNIV